MHRKAAICLTEPSRERDSIRLVGIYEDGWARPTFGIDYPAGRASRSLNVTLFSPKQSASKWFNLVAADGSGRTLNEYPFRRQQTVYVHIPLPETAGSIRLLCNAQFRQGGNSAVHQRHDVSVLVQRIEVKDLTSSTIVFSLPADLAAPRAKSAASAPLNVGFDISQTGANKAGCGYFADAMISGMLRLTPQNSYLLLRNFGDFFFDPDIQRVKPYSGKNVFYASGIDSRDKLAKYWASSDLPSKLAGLDILHANNFWCPRQRLSARLVYTLYDISFLEEPSWTTEVNRIGCFAGVFNAAIAADFIVAISKFSRRHFLRVFPHFPPDRIEVVYPCSKFVNLDSPGQRPAALRKNQTGQVLAQRWHDRTEEEPVPAADRLCAISCGRRATVPACPCWRHRLAYGRFQSQNRKPRDCRLRYPHRLPERRRANLAVSQLLRKCLRVAL